MAWVLLFDGDCALCSRTARWVARVDRRGHVGLAPLQSAFSRDRGLEHHASQRGGSLVMMDDVSGGILLRSDAVIQLARLLGWPWRVVVMLAVVPRCLRERIYQSVADRRHRWFGEVPRCALEDPAVTRRLRG